MINLKTYEEFDYLGVGAVIANFLIGVGIVRFFNYIKTLLKIKNIEKSAIIAIEKILKDKTEWKGKMEVTKGPNTITIISDKRFNIYGGTIYSFQLNTKTNKIEILIKRDGVMPINKNIEFYIDDEEKETILNIIEENVVNKFSNYNKNRYYQ